MITKPQRAVLLHMYETKTHLQRVAVWRYANGDGTVRETTVNALMRSGYITMGFNASSLTTAGVILAKEAVTLSK